MFLTVYSQTRHYGGPEEGGWWYDWHEPVASVELPQWLDADEVEAKREALLKVYDHLAEGDIGSVLGGTHVWVGREDEQYEFQTTRRPRYE